jgi:glucose/arabinose dehydrogenase
MRTMMKRFLLLLVIFLTACASLGTPTALTAVPAPVTDTTIAPNTEISVSPTPNGGEPTTIPPTSPPSSGATSFPDPTSYKWTKVISGFVSPVDFQFVDDGTGRMFVVEQAGRIRIVQNGQLRDPAFLDITDRVGSGGNEQGLLGLAFHPDFEGIPYFYVNYTDKNGNTVIARFQAEGDKADPGSEKDLLKIDQPFPNHNGGILTFGPNDGYLYLGLGDGGSQGDPNGNGQNTNVLLGKILRIDVDRGDPYSIPSDNPFAKGGGRPEIWAYGLRNPWRFSFDRLTGDLYIADVGQDLWEEVDVAFGNPPGLNYGWNYYEGMHPYSGQAPGGINFTFPVVEYSHAEGGCSVTGGYVYRGAMPEWQGIYLYGDFCSGKIWGLIHSPDPTSGKPWQSQVLFETKASITTFGEDLSGEIYFADRGGTIYRLEK